MIKNKIINLNNNIKFIKKNKKIYSQIKIIYPKKHKRTKSTKNNSTIIKINYCTIFTLCYNSNIVEVINVQHRQSIIKSI